MNFRLLLLTSFIFVVSSISAQQDGSSIGQVLLAEGTVYALDSNQNERKLEKSAPIYVEDIIKVGESSMAGIRMIDESLVTLVSNTEYKIKSFSYKSPKASNNFVSELSKGGFRMLSGNIGKVNPQKFEINTPKATIGLRGTVVEGLMQDDALYVHVNKGRATLTNEAGTVTIGTGTAEYAVISRFNELPQTLISRPAQLTPHFFVPQTQQRRSQ